MLTTYLFWIGVFLLEFKKQLAERDNYVISFSSVWLLGEMYDKSCFYGHR